MQLAHFLQLIIFLCHRTFKPIFMEQIEYINKVELQGRVGTVRTNEVNGSKVANFSMITEYLYKTREGAAVSEGVWHNIVAWSGKEIPNIDRIEKGAAVHVTGRLRTNRYTSSDGTEKLYYEVMANKVTVLDE